MSPPYAKSLAKNRPLSRQKTSVRDHKLIGNGLYYSVKGEGDISTSTTSFAQISVVNAQTRAIDPRQEKLFLYWSGDPPFDAFDVSAYLREQEAIDLEDKANMQEQQGSWANAV